MKIIKKVKVLNDLGLHIRPAAVIVKLLQSKQSSVYFRYKNDNVNARSVMGLVSLVAKKNAKITVTIEGKDAEKTMKEIIEAFQRKFGER